MRLKAQFRNLATKNQVPAQAVLQSFMLERLLERISISRYRDKFILKGGMLIASMVGLHNRTTMDMDTTLRAYPLSEEALCEALVDICAIQLDDEVSMMMDHIVPIRDDEEYGGYRAAIIARYEKISTPLKMDITTGDIITPAAVRYTFQSNFEDKLIEIWAYNLETILAEKVETILSRSVLNTRPRDFYDVYIIMKIRRQMVSLELFMSALKATSEKRMSFAALQDKETIVRAIQSDASMRERWNRYCKENYYAQGIDFDKVVSVLIDLLP